MKSRKRQKSLGSLIGKAMKREFTEIGPAKKTGKSKNRSRSYAHYGVSFVWINSDSVLLGRLQKTNDRTKHNFKLNEGLSTRLNVDKRSEIRNEGAFVSSVTKEISKLSRYGKQTKLLRNTLAAFST